MGVTFGFNSAWAPKNLC